MSASRSRKSRHKTPPDQAVAGPSREGKGNTGHRGRRLEFDAKKPLSGKKFYLELTGRQKLQLAKLKADIEELGGVVEPFLSKDLACVISDRAEIRDGERSKVMPSGTSPAVSTPSPFHQAKDVTPSAADSPSNVTQDSRVVTRGQAIVQKATKSQMYGTTDVLTNAKNFNIPVKHLDVLLKYLSREKEKLRLRRKDKKKGGKDAQGVKGKERQLVKPCLKGEDVSRRFRPIHKEFKTWPRILLDTRKGSCPYDPTTRNESNPQGAERTQDRPDASQKTPDVRHKETSRSHSLSRRMMSKAARERGSLATRNKATKKGFCEFCNVKYSSLEKHLQCDQHQQLVGEKQNYLSLDSMIAEGPNLSRFLEDCARFKTVNLEASPHPVLVEESDSESGVLLLPEPTSSVKKRGTARDPDSSALDRVVRNLGTLEERPSPAEDGHEPVGEDGQRQKNLRRCPKLPCSSPRKRARKGTSDVAISDAETRTNDLNQRLISGIDGAGDSPGNGTAINPTDSRATMEHSSTGEHPSTLERSCESRSPGASASQRSAAGRRRQSSCRNRLSLQPRKSMTVQTAPQGLPEGSSADTVSQGDVLRGVAGDEEPAPPQSHAEEVLITRVLRIDGAGEENDGEPCRSLNDHSPTGVKQTEHQAEGTNTRQDRVSGSVRQDHPASSHDTQELRAKRGSQAVSSPTSQQPSRNPKKRRLIADEAALDDVFVNDDVRLVEDNESLARKISAERNKNSGRFKRKSRRSHGEAPPRKVRGSSVAIDSDLRKVDALGNETRASPQVREPQPRVPTVLENSHSSDDFQPMKTPPSRVSKNSGRTGKRVNSSRDKNSDSSQKSSGMQRVTSKNTPSTSHHSAAESTTSELDFQLNGNTKGNSIRRGTQLKSKENRGNKSKGKHRGGPSIVNGTTHPVNKTNHSQHGIQGENIPDEGTLGSTVIANNAAEENVGLETTEQQQQQSLEFVFRSDLGQEESSFLGFSQDEINDTISRSESSRQVQELSGQLVQNLEKAALSVYCLPSSDPPAADNDDDKSSVGSFGEFTIGLVLQKVDSFASDGSEWEEKVTGFMEKLDTQLEIKRRRESELSTLPSPNFHKSVLAHIEKENQTLLHQDVHEDSVFAEEVSNNTTQAPRNSGTLVHDRRRSARIHKTLKPLTRSTPKSNRSYSGMCSPSKRKKTPLSAKGDGMPPSSSLDSPGPKQALRELSSNQLPHSPQPSTRPMSFSTPRRTKKSLLEIQGSPKSPRTPHIVLPPGTSHEVQKEIVDNYVHDDSESEVVFPKFSSPPQKGSIFSPVKHRVRRKRVKRRNLSESCLGHRNVQSSPIRPTYMEDWSTSEGASSARKALFMKGKVKHIKFASPRRRSKSVSHSPTKSSHFLTFLNELKAGLSPVFYTFKKPHFSLRILQPSARRSCCRTRLSRSLLALNLSLPANFDLRIYEFHDDESLDEDVLNISPLRSGNAGMALTDRCTQTPPSSRRPHRSRPRRLAARRESTGEETESVECVEAGERRRSVCVQTSSPHTDSYFNMPSDYFF